MITKRLDTHRCYLRKLEISDAQKLFENIFSDNMVSRYMSWDCYTDVVKVKEYLTEWQKYYEENECYWGVFLKSNDDLIGTIYLCDENRSAGVAFISYCLCPEYWGRGYATETVKAVINYAFHKLDYNNITTFCAESNIPSQNVLKRLGFTFESKLRKRDKTHLGLEDCLFYSLLKDEWTELLKNNMESVAMIHNMYLNNEPFEKIASGQKTIELRLYDEKRRKIKVGDIIEFTNNADKSKKIAVTVKCMHIFKSFAELYKSLLLDKCGYSQDKLNKADPSDMNEYYSKYKQKKYGVVGIEIELI